MKPRHTQGPWTFDGMLIYEDDHRENAKDIAVIQSAWGTKAENNANARLIAAAPDMYALLHALWSKTDPANPDCKKIARLLDSIDTGKAK